MIRSHLVCVVLLVAGVTYNTFAQGTTFTYQGRLQDGGTNANGSYDFQFTLWDALTDGTQQPQPTPVTVTRTNVSVVNGVFTVQLDFGASAFPGADRFLETSVRLAGGGPFSILSPRQPITPTPYALRSASASTADVATTATNATQLGSIAANQYVVTTDSRLSDSRVPTAGSSNYIQNNTTQQASSNFNISGDGIAGGILSSSIVNASNQYNLGGNRVLSITGTSNIFSGVNAGQANTSGSNNSFFGRSAGSNNTSGANNSFFGSFTGSTNTTGGNNSFFGQGSGFNNTSGSANSFFGINSGLANTTGGDNSFFGNGAGLHNNTGIQNSFFGESAGLNNTGGFANSFFGIGSGASNTTGSRNVFNGENSGLSNTIGNNNSFIGDGTGSSNTTGGSNTALGFIANVASGALTNATAIGANAQVSQSNSLVLGSINGINSASADTNVGIGTTAPSERLHVVGNGLFTGNLAVNGTFSTPIVNAGTQFNIAGHRMFISTGGDPQPFNNIFIGESAGAFNSTGADNSFLGWNAGKDNNSGASNSFFGFSAGISNQGGSNNSIYGASAGILNVGGASNSFFGSFAGHDNVSGIGNSFFGYNAGSTNQTGSTTTALGYFANFGFTNLNNATAIGASARADESNSLVLGSINGVNFATADTNVGIGTTQPVTSEGARLAVVQNDAHWSMHIRTNGRPTGTSYGLLIDAGTNNADDALLVRGQAGGSILRVRGNGNIGVGTDNPSQLLHLFRSGSTSNLISFGNDEWQIGNTNTGDFTIFRGGTQQIYITNTGNVGIGTSSPVYRLNVNQTTPNTFAANVQTTGVATGSSYGLVVSAGTDVTDSAMQIRDQAGNPIMRVRGDGTVGIGTTNPLAKLHVLGDTIFTGNTNTSGNANVTGALTVGGTVSITGQLNVHTMVTVGTSQVCINGDLFTRCSSSSLRYKTNLGSFQRGLEVVNNLHPITFTWKADGKSDFGLGAEDVEKVAPELVFYRDGQVEGVKYDRIGVVLINAVKEQQAQILKQQEQIKRQQDQIARDQNRARQDRAMFAAQQLQLDALKKLVCSSHRRARACR